MSNDYENLNELTAILQRMNSKMILLKLIIKAKTEYDKYDYEAGRKSLIEAYLIDKKNPTVLRGLGCINQFKGKWNSAVRYFKAALKYSKKKEVEYTLLGMAYYLKNEFEDAVNYFNLAIECNDEYEQAYEGRNQSMLENHLRIVDLQEALKKHL